MSRRPAPNPTEKDRPVNEPNPYTLNDALSDVEITITPDGTALTAIRRAELDRQGETARKHNRSVTAFMKRLTGYVTVNQEVAEECLYALPRGGRRVTGASVRFAELALVAWGNMDVGVTLISLDREAAVLEGRCTDHETNTSTSLVTRRPVQAGDLRGVREDKREAKIRDAMQLAVSSGTSIAKRNAILSAIPRAFWVGPLRAASQAALGDGTLEERRNRAIDWFVSRGAEPKKVYEAAGVEGFHDLSLDHLQLLSAIKSSVRSGEMTVAEALQRDEDNGSKARTSLADRLAEASTAASEPTQREPTDANAETEVEQSEQPDPEVEQS